MLKKRTIKNIVFSFLILGITLLICEVLYRNNFGAHNINIIMCMALFAIAVITDGYVYGVFSAIIAVFTYDFVIITPRFGFSFTVGFPITLIIMLAVVLVSSAITSRMKIKIKTNRDKCELAELLYSINSKLLSTREVKTIARYSMEYLKDELNHSVAFYEEIPLEGKITPFFRQGKDDVNIDYFMQDKVFDCVRQVLSSKQPLDVNGIGFFYPVAIQDQIYGVFAFSCGENAFTHKKKVYLNLIASQTAQALRIYRLVQEQQEASVSTETEKLKNSLLRSISHDLRTPLTGIIGSSGTLLENSDDLPKEVQIKLIQGIQRDSEWLLNMIENILSITKVQGNNMKIEKTDELVEEAVEEAVINFHKYFPKAKVTVKQPDHSVWVPMDIILISQVLTNLLENTQRHAQNHKSDVIVEVRESEDLISFVVQDNGPGMEVHVLENLFQCSDSLDSPYHDSSKGWGIGLSICKTIINAHGGEIKAANLPEGGAQFTFTLPVWKKDGYIYEE